MKTLTEKRFFEWHEDDISVTLRNKSGSYGGGQAHDAYCPDYEKSKTLNCMDDPMKILEKGEDMNTVVRRLTPKECERLQGFPDGWTDIGEWTDSNGKVRQTVDSARYKALGNAIALPFWEWLAHRIRAEYPAEAEVTMASLFDGIGGFPLVFSRADVKPVWASEIEEFPISVTKRHFPDEVEI